MRRQFFILILIISLLILIGCVAASFIGGSTSISRDFPLSEKWTAKLRGNIQQITNVDNAVLIARTTSEIYAVDVHTGTIIWEQNTEPQISYQPVLARGDRLYFSDGKGILVLNKSDGKILWQQPIRHPSGGDVLDVTADLVAVNDPPFLTVFKAADGAFLWEKDICRGRVQAYFFDAHIIVPCHGLNILDSHSGEIIWERKFEDRIYRSAFADGVIYFSEDLENITGYDVSTRKLWKTPLKNTRSQAFKVVEEYLFVTQDSQLRVLNRDKGRILWCADNLIKAKNPVIFENNLYLFNGLQNGITAYDIHDGREIGRLDFPIFNFITVENVRQLLVASEDTLIFASRNKIYAYGH